MSADYSGLNMQKIIHSLLDEMKDLESCPILVFCSSKISNFLGNVEYCSRFETMFHSFLDSCAGLFVCYNDKTLTDIERLSHLDYA